MKNLYDGNKAVSEMAYLLSDLCFIYPITPSSPMASNVDYLSSKNEYNYFNNVVNVVEMQSEAGASGAMHGALLSGSLASTFTSSQGLLLMLPNMYKMAGEMLPAVIHTASRALSTHALSIFGDHQDVYAATNTGFNMIASSSVEEARDMALISHLVAVDTSLPVLHFFDGFRTSHELNTINVVDKNKLMQFIDTVYPKNALKDYQRKSLYPNNAISSGLAENEDVYFQKTKARNIDYTLVPKRVDYYMNELNQYLKTDYKPFNYYGDIMAENIIIAMGSVCDTIKNTIDIINENGGHVGLISVHLFRPFSKDYLTKEIPKTVKKIAVLDRNLDMSLEQLLYLNVLNALKDYKDVTIISGSYGLGGKDTTIADINAVYKNLDDDVKDNFTIGIIDDISHSSLKPMDLNENFNGQEFKIYGFGSDGMISASKSILDLIVNSTEKYAQGYFEYDSKKSGGVTISHLRVSDQKIRAPYKIKTPELLVITKDNYLNKYDELKNIKENSTIIINTDKSVEDFKSYIKSGINNTFILKNANVYLINAEEIANKYNLNGKISMIMERVILEFLHVPNYYDSLISSIKTKFKTKGENVVNANLNAIENCLEKLIKVDLINKETQEENNDKTIFEIINDRKGNDLTVKNLDPLKNGRCLGALSTVEKRNSSGVIPFWDKRKCIECGKCSLVCPHGVIRPFIIEDDKGHGKDSITKKGSKFILGISNEDCTGCGLCAHECPTNCLTMGKNIPTNEFTKFLFNEYENPECLDKFTIKGSQLIKPKFEFSGACAGCGETAYIKLLTQLFGKKLIIANATGCSSIYGGSFPSTPYSIPWASSLFEDNAEFGLGIYRSVKMKKEKIINIMNISKELVDNHVKELFNEYIENYDDVEKTLDIKEELKNHIIPNELKELINYVPASSIWCIGGDGWAYDIGFGGLDHVLASNENINILVLDTEVYSNTGGQVSKSSHMGQIGEFASFGKKTNKKDLFRMCMSYDNVYVASVSIGSNPLATIKAFKEAEAHNGPSIIIAYSPCIEQGIKNGMCNQIDEQKKLVEAGYLLLMRRNPSDGKLTIDSKEPDFDKLEKIMLNEVRYRALNIKDEKLFKNYLMMRREYLEKRYNYFKNKAI